MDDNHWSVRALCKDNPELMWPTSGNSLEGKRQIRAAKELCFRCPVLDACRTEVMSWKRGEREVGMVAAGRYYCAGSDLYDRSKKKPVAA